MIRLASKATLLSAVALVVAGAALAGVPNATNSSLGGTHLTLTGYNTTVVPGQNTPQPLAGGFEAQSITVRDAANNPVANSVVVLNFNACYNGVGPKLSTAQPPGMSLSGRSVSGTTNASGVVVFKICGASNNTIPNGPEPVNCVSVVADGVPLGSFSVATFDENGSGLIDGSDFGLFANDRNAVQPANYRNRSDYNKDNVVNGSDFSLFANARNGQYGGSAGGTVGPFVP
jgi:hypothetical protein